MKKRMLTLIMLAVLAASACLFTSCEKIDNEVNYDTVRAALVDAGFITNDYSSDVLSSPMYANASKGFFATRIQKSEGGEITTESVAVFLLPDKKTMDGFIKVFKGRYVEAYTRGLMYYAGGDPLLTMIKSATPFVFDIIGGDKLE